MEIEANKNDHDGQRLIKKMVHKMVQKLNMQFFLKMYTASELLMIRWH